MAEIVTLEFVSRKSEGLHFRSQKQFLVIMVLTGAKN